MDNRPAETCGVLNMNKPAGMTSRRAVDAVQRLARPAKVGHAGTLDPLATGVLVVCVGRATRLIEYVQRMRKSYTGTFLLGRSSPTEDVEGQVTELANPPVPTLSQIEAAAAAMVGHIQQRPPAFSAVKVAGRRAYALARQGADVQLHARPVTVYRIAVGHYAYPELRLDIECGSGTYVRSLGRDLAESLGTAAVMSALVRTAIGQFRIGEAAPPDELSADTWQQHLLPPLLAAVDLPCVELSPEEAERIGHGLSIEREVPAAGGGEFAGVDATGRLVAILTTRGPGRLGPLRNLI